MGDGLTFLETLEEVKKQQKMTPWDLENYLRTKHLDKVKFAIDEAEN